MLRFNLKNSNLPGVASNPIRLASQAGFTLVEAIVATTLFIVVTGAIMGVYLYTLRINRRADTIRTSTENARFLSEFLTKEIRNGRINYAPTVAPCIGIPNYNNPEYRISIVNVDGDKECFYKGDAAGNPSAQGTSLWLIKNFLSPVKLNSSNVTLPAFSFYIYPTYDPKCKNPPACTQNTDIQPAVTIIGQIQTSEGPNDITTIPIETTISIPQYDLGP